MSQNKKFYKCIAIMLKPFLKVLFPYEVTGLENIPNISNGYILCSNHLSNLDPVFFTVIHPCPICFMAKEELFKNKFTRWFFSLMGAFSVKRGKGDRQAINEAEQILKNGDVLGIFIEGTRSKTGDFLRPKSGVALLAQMTQVPVLPVCITGTAPDHKVHIFKKTIIRYNSPITHDELNLNDGTRTQLKCATNLIMDKIKELRD